MGFGNIRVLRHIRIKAVRDNPEHFEHTHYTYFYFSQRVCLREHLIKKIFFFFEKMLYELLEELQQRKNYITHHFVV